MDDDAPPSKTRRKQESHALQDIGKELVALSPDQLQKLEAPAALIEAVHEARRISKFGALRRQMQYIGRLMRDVDATPIRAQLDAWKGRSDEETARLHRIERWRTRLLADETALGEFIAAHPQADAQRVRALVRNAQREAAAQKPPKSFRELFQVLREVLDSKAD